MTVAVSLSSFEFRHSSLIRHSDFVILVSPMSSPLAIVTGSARGIGRAISLELARTGYSVLLNSVRSDPADLKHEIESLGQRAEICRADISLHDDRNRLVDCALKLFNRIDLLVNNAGIAPPKRADILEASEESFDTVLTTNLKGPYFLTQRVAAEMIKLKQIGRAPKPRICFITSISSYTASTNRGDYCLSKSALSMAVQLFAARLADHDIPVLEFRPGVIATDMTSAVKEKYDKMFSDGTFPQKRWGTPQDIAKAVASFARGDLDYSTGISIDISGGFQLRRL
jgi:3-oxoacyl-[acyl-carrier protein] reductase